MDFFPNWKHLLFYIWIHSKTTQNERVSIEMKSRCDLDEKKWPAGGFLCHFPSGGAFLHFYLVLFLKVVTHEGGGISRADFNMGCYSDRKIVTGIFVIKDNWSQLKGRAISPCAGDFAVLVPVYCLGFAPVEASPRTMCACVLMIHEKGPFFLPFKSGNCVVWWMVDTPVLALNGDECVFIHSLHIW